MSDAKSEKSHKIVSLFPDVYLIPGATNVGVISKQNEEESGITDLFLIDSGASELDTDYILDSIKNHFTNQPYKIRVIINTHGHPDHVGGNAAFQRALSCPVWIPERERGWLENPEINSTILCSGYPIKELRTLFFMQEKSIAHKLLNDGDEYIFKDGTKLLFLDLPGHSYQEMGIFYCAKDGTKIGFTGDAIFTEKQMGKYWIPFMHNPNQFMASLDKLCKIENLSMCIPSHGKPITDNLEETAELNKLAIISTKTCIMDTVRKNKKTFEQILKEVTDYHEIKMSVSQYYLIGSTIKSYLSVLHDEGKIAFEMIDNVLYYYIKT